MTAPAFDFEPDALDPTLYVRGVAHETFDWLRENDPVHWDERNHLWVISKYEDLSYVERQPELFCSGQGIRPKGGGAGNLSIVSLDDPEHARQRRLVSRGFTPSRITEMLDHIRDVARGLVDAVAARGECDFVEDIAKPLPLIVIAELLGLPGRGPPAARRVVRRDDDGGERRRRRSQAGSGGRSVGGLRHLPRRADRGAPRRSAGRPDLDPPLVGRRRCPAVPRGRGAGPARERRAPDERPHRRRTADRSACCCSSPATRRRATRSPAASRRCRGSRSSASGWSPTCRSSAARPRRSSATCRR